MAIFGSKKKKVEKVEKVVAIRESSSLVNIPKDIILRPRITEKSGLANETLNVYTFEVSKLATKDSITRAIKNIYKVNPTKVRTITLPSKNVFNRGRKGVTSGVKKALVYLKKGDKIEFA